MADEGNITIIGAGITGVHAAENLRNEGYQGRIVLLDRDIQLPYDRPPLSKEWMVGERDDTNILLRDRSFYETLDINLRLGVEVTDIDPDSKFFHTNDGSSYVWDKLMLATGSNLRALSIKGNDLKGVFNLRRMADATAIKQHLKHVGKAVIVGAGFIGLELASSLKKLGIDVTVVEMSTYPMENIFGRQISEHFLDFHRGYGIEVITEDSVVRFNGEMMVEEAVTDKGRHIPCQTVIMGVGVKPNTEVSHPRLHIDGGYIVNEYGETSIPDIYAAGDCTVWPYQGSPVHVEHWDHAINHAKTVAQNMNYPQSVPYTYIPYFWSDQYDSRLQYFGHAKVWSKTVLRGSMESNAFTYFYMDDQNVVKAAFISNQPQNALPVRRIIKQQKAINPESLADESVTLKKIQRYMQV